MYWLILLCIALIASSCGFKKYIYFISIGYGFAIAAEGALMAVLFREKLTLLTILTCALLALYGLRLGGYLWIRERRSAAYAKLLEKETNHGKTVPLPVKCAIWVSASILYVCQVSPLLFRLQNGRGSAGTMLAGLILSVLGVAMEALADWQKARAKRKDPHHFVSSGLFSFVRCPNYLGELLLWTGMFVSGFTALQDTWQWTSAIAGYVGLIYVMFSGARRLEVRQNRNYGSDPAYQAYVKKTPIMLPFVPLYSVEKYKWLVA